MLAAPAANTVITANIVFRISCLPRLGVTADVASRNTTPRRKRFASGTFGASFYLGYAGALDHFFPLFRFRDDHGAERLGRTDQRLAAGFGQTRLDPRVGQDRVDLLVELFDDLLRRDLPPAHPQHHAPLLTRNRGGETQ